MKTALNLMFAAAILFVACLASATQQQLTGIVSDSMCGAAHMSKDKTPAECTRICVKAGSQYALVVGDKLYVLEGHESEVEKLAGQKATVKGDLSGSTLKVSSIQPNQ